MSEFLIAMKKESRDKNVDGQLIEIQTDRQVDTDKYFASK